MIYWIYYLHTPTSLPSETCMFRIICTCLCARWDLVDLNDLHIYIEPEWDLFGYIFHRYLVDVYLSNLWVMYNHYLLIRILSVRSAKSAHVYQRIFMLCRICIFYLSGVWVVCKICTPGSGMYDLHDMHLFISGSA